MKSGCWTFHSIWSEYAIWHGAVEILHLGMRDKRQEEEGVVKLFVSNFRSFFVDFAH